MKFSFLRHLLEIYDNARSYSRRILGDPDFIVELKNFVNNLRLPQLEKHEAELSYQDHYFLLNLLVTHREEPIVNHILHEYDWRMIEIVRWLQNIEMFTPENSTKILLTRENNSYDHFGSFHLGLAILQNAHILNQEKFDILRDHVVYATFIAHAFTILFNEGLLNSRNKNAILRHLEHETSILQILDGGKNKQEALDNFFARLNSPPTTVCMLRILTFSFNTTTEKKVIAEKSVESTPAALPAIDTPQLFPQTSITPVLALTKAEVAYRCYR